MIRTARLLAIAAVAIVSLPLAVHAGIADSPLPVLVAGKTTLHVYSVTGVQDTDNLDTFFSCTSTDKATMQVGVEVFGSLGSAGPANDAVATSLSLAPGDTRTFGTHPHNFTPFVFSDLGLPGLDAGSARILATSKKLICTAFLFDSGNAPPTSMVYLTIVKKTSQKGE